MYGCLIAADSPVGGCGNCAQELVGIAFPTEMAEVETDEGLRYHPRRNPARMVTYQPCFVRWKR